MPITLDKPVDAPREIKTEETFQATHLYCDWFLMDAKNRSAPPILQLIITPYRIVDGVNDYASTSWKLNTSNIYAASKNLPGLLPLIMGFLDLVKNGAMLWNPYQIERLGELSKAQAILADAQAAEAKTVEARNAAFAARKDISDPTWITADAAWQQAVQATQAAQGNVTIATAGLADPANPPVKL